MLARVEYDFVGETEDELSVSAGSVIKVAPKDKQPRMRGWLLATADGEREGIVPANYVKVTNTYPTEQYLHHQNLPCKKFVVDVGCFLFLEI